MAKWFVFVDTQYYPYVANEKNESGDWEYLPIEADTAEEAVEKSDAGQYDDCFVAPWESVKAVSHNG